MAGVFQTWAFFGNSPQIPKGTLRLLQESDPAPIELGWLRVLGLDISLPGSFDLAAKAAEKGVIVTPVSTLEDKKGA